MTERERIVKEAAEKMPQRVSQSAGQKVDSLHWHYDNLFGDEFPKKYIEEPIIDSRDAMRILLVDMLGKEAGELALDINPDLSPAKGRDELEINRRRTASLRNLTQKLDDIEQIDPPQPDFFKNR